LVAVRLASIRQSIAPAASLRYISRVHHLTKQEQLVLCFVVGLLLIGWAVKVYRAAHPPQTPAVVTVKAAGK